jgi:predicted NUDIX family phosphoesterase
LGQFTKAAYQVLKKEMRPLGAREIAEIAAKEGLLRSAGKTPWQTMKSKLSTDILSHGSESLFMRVEEGRFSLREWKGLYPEHIAHRFQKALFDEDIVVFPAKSLSHYVPSVGLYSGKLERDALIRECHPMRRRDAEEDTSVIQLVSVFVVRFQDRILTYKRTKRLPESRLHGYYSLGFGGHLNPEDLKPLLNIFDPDVAAPLLLRELGEELRLNGDEPKLRYRGLLYDDSRPVSKQHLGITYDVFLRLERFEIGERGFLMDAKFEALDQVIARKQDSENWSWILIQEEQECKPSLLQQT